MEELRVKKILFDELLKEENEFDPDSDYEFDEVLNESDFEEIISDSDFENTKI